MRIVIFYIQFYFSDKNNDKHTQNKTSINISLYFTNQLQIFTDRFYMNIANRPDQNTNGKTFSCRNLQFTSPNTNQNIQTSPTSALKGTSNQQTLHSQNKKITSCNNPIICFALFIMGVIIFLGGLFVFIAEPIKYLTPTCNIQTPLAPITTCNISSNQYCCIQSPQNNEMFTCSPNNFHNVCYFPVNNREEMYCCMDCGSNPYCVLSSSIQIINETEVSSNMNGIFGSLIFGFGFFCIIYGGCSVIFRCCMQDQQDKPVSVQQLSTQTKGNKKKKEKTSQKKKEKQKYSKVNIKYSIGLQRVQKTNNNQDHIYYNLEGYKDRNSLVRKL